MSNVEYYVMTDFIDIESSPSIRLGKSRRP
jgi:hypothetical protein